VRILIYQNPDAGHERGLPHALVERLQRAGHEVAWRNSKEDRLNDPTVGAFDLIVAAGGDGSVGRTARQLVGGTVPIAVLPLGTANNLASILDAGKHDLADRITEWAIVPFDAGTADWASGEPEWFFEGFGIGAFAETAARLTKLARSGSTEVNREAELARDIAALRDQARDQPPIDTEVHMDDRVIYARLLMLEALNIGLIGPKVELASGVDPSDGALDVVLVDEGQRGTLVAYLEALAAGREPEPPFTATRTRDVRVRVPSGACAHVDGRSVDLPAPAEVRLGVQPHAVRFLGGTSG
jgi:diacylglycerol kinase family enzyme